MSKAIIEFDLSDHDDARDHKICMKAPDMAIMIWDLIHNSKKTLEYKIDDKISKDETFNAYDALDLVYEHIYELLEENSIYINDLIE